MAVGMTTGIRWETGADDDGSDVDEGDGDDGVQ